MCEFYTSLLPDIFLLDFYSLLTLLAFANVNCKGILKKGCLLYLNYIFLQRF